LQDPILKIPSQKRAGGMAWVVEHLPRKLVSLEFKPQYQNKQPKKKKKKLSNQSDYCPVLFPLTDLHLWCFEWSLISL
jgi:hypothetical protein